MRSKIAKRRFELVITVTRAEDNIENNVRYLARALSYVKMLIIVFMRFKRFSRRNDVVSTINCYD